MQLTEISALIETVPEKYLPQIVEYLRGDRREFVGNFTQKGTPFQQKVWCAISQIHYGETKTYGEIALLIGHPKAARAVGTACGKNQLPIVIPCHRVLASNGIGGYAFNLEIKKRLLALERDGLTAQKVLG